LSIGHCIDRATGEPCRDFDAEFRDFVALEEDVAVPQTIGFQGSPMFVLAIRVDDNDPSPGARQPLIQLEVNLGTDFVGGYTARPDLVEDPNDASHKIAPQLYVITLLGEDTNGEQAVVNVGVTTDTGEEWCATALFEVGALITEPIPP
tara:strand:+ start:15996 stop:16442 length:447 start_codon:yes stop_codon:yes gene_type:complete